MGIWTNHLSFFSSVPLELTICLEAKGLPQAILRTTFAKCFATVQGPPGIQVQFVCHSPPNCYLIVIFL